MKACFSRHVPLKPHPSCVPGEDFVLTGTIALTDEGIHLAYQLTGPVERLLIPLQGRGVRRDGLWQHTCLEAFFKQADQPPYWELNFSPSRDWAAYAFESYRQPSPLPHLPDPVMLWEHSPTQLRLTVTLPHFVPFTLAPQRLCVGLSAVLEDKHGLKTYWALAHPQAKPDFHHEEAFRPWPSLAKEV